MNTDTLSVSADEGSVFFQQAAADLDKVLFDDFMKNQVLIPIFIISFADRKH
ncbi:hypothetical protein LI951_11645 [Enterococcus sp. BWT-B8]|uniref:hypothetical protein n=1 Tax=Enterococcus sp. BWT-B8 TaxID=2885157 RepID=UPI001E3A646B|nr:hypothetical protein [Enterococcus sp. BWT-B8]MCB5952722.1 hypothetical protein [Enterococcus sp. BWT-B8]